ncbi:hypothetical protein CEE37_03460 [candidate division LCP-89 bacterium B3_LCP]|uniref:Peptidase S8/S53 domain-containing protein n=1 Tax=candidate division LCP-89 bacterium B3_LCP TaxID=2012998 RepID=A0A532V3R6_UNCL8|nr:MAG: hypothetical protein CEE37_03460 [candidate division LCP-89 bacterium B3_LCP]
MRYFYHFGAVFVLCILIGVVSIASPPLLTANNEWQGRLVIEVDAALVPLEISNESDLALTGIAELDNLARSYGVYSMSKLFPNVRNRENSHYPALSRFYLLEFSPEVSLSGITAAYSVASAVTHAEPYYVFHPLHTPNDSLYYAQWALTHINAETAFDYSLGSEEIIIGVVDMGIDTTHEDLRGNLWINPGEDLNGNGIVDPSEWNNIDDEGNGFVDDFWGWNFYDNDNIVQESPLSSGHGTFVSGGVSAVTDNYVGIASLGCKAKIMTAKVGEDFYIVTGIEGITYCVENGADVINLSWGSPTLPYYLQVVLDYAWSEGVVVVAAAGGDGGMIPIYPAACDNVLAVSSTDADDHLAPFANYGYWVDVFAPGIDILSTFPSDNYDMWSGTSGSAALASGLASFIWAADLTLTNEEIVDHILATSVEIDSLNPGFEGLLRIDAGAALAGIFLDIVLTPENPPIIIPASGATFNYNIMVENSDDVEHESDLWVYIILPDNTQYGPVLGPVSLTLAGNSSVDRDRSQRVPANAPAGSYQMIACLGSYPGSICSRDTIPFDKLGSTIQSSNIGDIITGDSSASSELSEVVQVLPNPFNPVATIGFYLETAGSVELMVFDVHGRPVKQVEKTHLFAGRLQSGYHEIEFDGSGLPSGVYIYRLMMENRVHTGKMILMK